MDYVLPPLPYAANALVPLISERALEIHHGKHHAAYLAKLKILIAGTEYNGASLAAIIARTARDPACASIFNNAAQAHNHQFFWESMATPGTTSPGAAVTKAITASFGSVDAFRNSFVEAGKNHFASGWVWAVAERNRIEILTTANAGTPLGTGKTPLLVCDLWEHAYYLDYQQARNSFLTGFAAQLIDWNRVNSRLNAHAAASAMAAA